ncbi:carboxymuconolactone decarboxylase family protein [Luteolibacter pohnpeiensis]|uniref:Carboxymuconolactone decarboxylase family protein n=1 Tax=Luteolibacter pohnpeiensis TaxID=454153 RepID=A0A934SDW2_9BACT|nr:carboxymuconolactone decarboxylase family protein [Luteolibacter pohnpeiensis]MBK1883428.1 carboxymuconolactone decarboxylase family protein [Luteolibacter pohnpeiensis]
MANWKEILGGEGQMVGTLWKEHPDLGAAFSQLQKANFKEKVLSVKQKEHIAVALAIAARCDGCIAHHINAAIKAGCTREELVEVAGVAILMGGGPSNYYASKALQAFDEFTAEA